MIPNHIIKYNNNHFKYAHDTCDFDIIVDINQFVDYPVIEIFNMECDGWLILQSHNQYTSYHILGEIGDYYILSPYIYTISPFDITYVQKNSPNIQNISLEYTNKNMQFIGDL